MGDVPDPNPNPDPNLDPNPNPDPSPAPAGERPEWLPENLWTDKGFNADEFGKYRAPPADLPEAADKYELPKIDGIEIDAEDPLLPILRSHAHANGIGQEGFNKILSDYVTKLNEDDEKHYTDTLAAIGDNARGRIDNVGTWLDGKLPPDQAKALKALTSDANAMLGLEKLMNSGVTTPPRDNNTPPAPQRKTHAEIRQLMQSPKYSGKPLERDATVIKEVEDWFKEEERLKATAAKPA